MSLTPVALSEEQQHLFDYIETTQNNIFVTGRAGTGKSTLLAYFIENTKKSVAVCAPTGVAALNVGGATIHSLFTLPFGLLADVDISKHLGRRTREVLAGIDTLVIDEVSMVSADLMDAISRAMGIARGKRRVPFGGAQVVMFGDPYQLAPVVDDETRPFFYAGESGDGYRSPWFFDAHVWRQTELERYELSQIFRQSDERFKEILNAIRDGSCTQAMLDELNSAGNRWPPHEDVIKLATNNARVDSYNASRLAQLTSPAKVFHGKFASGDQKIFGRALPADPALTVKVGSQVMFIKNDDGNLKDSSGSRMRRWVNGTIGHVIALPDRGGVTVKVDDDVFEVGVSTWEKVRYEVEQEFDETTQKWRDVVVPHVLAEYQQIPLRLAWAVTVHKSQGQTYNEAQIDMGQGAFAPGQTYVALSRIRSLEGLYLTRAIQLRDIQVDPDVVRFMTEHKQITSKLF